MTRSIRGKLFAAFSAVLIVLLATIGLIYMKVGFIQETSRWRSHSANVLDALTGIASSMVNQETGVRGYLLSGDDQFLDPFRHGQEDFSAAWSEAKSLTQDNPGQQGLLDAIQSHAKSWQNDVAKQEIALMAKRETVSDARHIESSGAGKTSMDGVRTLVDEAVRAERQLLATRIAAQSAAYDMTYMIIMAGVVVSTLVAMAAALWLNREVTARIVRLAGAMRQLAERDYLFDLSFATRADEIGDMARAIDECRDGLKRSDAMAAAQATEQTVKTQRAASLEKLTEAFEANVGHMVGQVAASATELQATADSMTHTASQTTQQANNVAAAAEQASTNVQTVASAAEQLASSIAEISRQLAQSARVAGKAQEDAKRTDDVVKALADAAQKIGEVVGLISSIAGQTNLLALNATIEAARAGDAGKGFAVVASEVKSLATQTAKATENISQQIATIQTATEVAVKSIGGIGLTIGEISQIAASVAAAVEEQGAATAEIARNVQQAAIGTQEVTSNITGVSQGANSTGSAAGQVLGAAGELSQRAEQVRREVERYIAGVKAA